MKVCGVLGGSGCRLWESMKVYCKMESVLRHILERELVATHGVFEISWVPAARRLPRLIRPRRSPLASKLPSREAIQLEKRLAPFSLAVFAMVVEMERHV